MRTETITLPLPASELSPNARCHWAKKAPITKAHRNAGYLNAVCCGHIESYMLYFFWKDRRRHDKDNATACCKAYLDGISDAIEQDDSEWDFNGVRFAVDKENPRLEVRVVLK